MYQEEYTTAVGPMSLVFFADAIDHGSVHLTGNADRIRQVMHCFDLASMESA